MPPTSVTREELFRAESLLERGEYGAALQVVKRLSTREALTVEDRLACELFESRLRVKLGELKESLVLADEVLQKARRLKNRLLVVDVLLVKTEALWRSGRFDEGLRAVQEGEELIEGMELEYEGEQERKIKHRKGEVLHQKGIISWYRGDLDKALECHRQSLLIKDELGDKQGIAYSLNNLGLVYRLKGDLDQALEYHKRSLSVSEELGNMKNIAALLNNIGIIHQLKGDLDQALEYYKRSLKIKEELDLKSDITTSLINIGGAFQLKGDLDQALKYYQQSLTISKALGIKHSIALGFNNIGSIYQLKGDFDQALQHFQRSLEIYEDLGMKQEIALSLTNIGETYHGKGNSEEALKHYQKSLEIYEAIGNIPLIAIVLFNQVWVAIEMNDTTLVQEYLQKLRQINEQTDNRVIDQRYRIAEALSLKTSRRVRHKMRAEEILEQVVKEEVVDHSLTVTAMIHLCDLLLSELKMTGEDELFEEIKNLTAQLHEIAEQQSSHSLLVETYLLQSKLAFIEMNMGQAKDFLEKARIIAQEKGLQKLARAVAHDQDLLLSQLTSWEGKTEYKFSKREMIDLTKLDELLEQMIRKTVANLREEKGTHAIEAKELGIRRWLKGPSK